jgi:hypothetical protein
MNGLFEPSYATKVYFPKKSGILRPYSLLCIEDQLVYQALIGHVAEKLRRHVGMRYNRTVFGNLFAGKRSKYFYQDWRKGYRAFSDAIRTTVDKGFVYSASFDLTACYDSIDHNVLSHFLSTLELEQEFRDFLNKCLRRWTVAKNEKPIYIGHGIPQGPLPSGLLSEVVLRHFDEDKRDSRHLRYFRYVDDIRLFSKSEESLRRELIHLDRLSKEIGLFPQTGKIEIHQVRNIEEEIKSISHPPEWEARRYDPNQEALRQRLRILSPRLRIQNETRFKYVLGRAAPNAQLSIRLLKIVDKQPHLYQPMFRYLSRSPRLSNKVSLKCIEMLEKNDLYSAFTALLIHSIKDNLGAKYSQRLHKYCRLRLTDKTMTYDPELRAGVVGTLLRDGKLSWAQTRYNVTWSGSWWLRATVIQDLDMSKIGPPSYEYILNLLMEDESADVAVVAADYLIANSLNQQRNIKSINIIAQHSLRNAGKIGKVLEGTCSISRFMIATLGQRVSVIQWKKIGGISYDIILAKVVRWAAYAQTDATAWVNLTDTINDMILDLLFSHDGTIGNRQVGNFGAGLQSGSRFALKYPAFYKAVRTIHKRRVETDLSHAMVRRSGRATRTIRFRELTKFKSLLIPGYLELWKMW